MSIKTGNAIPNDWEMVWSQMVRLFSVCRFITYKLKFQWILKQWISMLRKGSIFHSSFYRQKEEIGIKTFYWKHFHVPCCHSLTACLCLSEFFSHFLLHTIAVIFASGRRPCCPIQVSLSKCYTLCSACCTAGITCHFRLVLVCTPTSLTFPSRGGA